jgi:hypothetical protein
MRFQVPQFIEVEDKIFGPLTFKQFIYIAGAIAIGVIFFTILPRFIAFLVAAPIVIFGLALAFYKVNEKPFISLVEAFFSYTLGSKLYIWKKEERKPVPHQEQKLVPKQVQVPKYSASRLKDLSFALDIKENENPVTK